MSSSVRVRFAPSPTGFMHLGNVRASLLNYLFAKQHQGTFILRIEDTDTQRNISDGQEKIIADLAWLHLNFNEGPTIGGNYGPYCQSERHELYKQHLEQLINTKKAYQCFCTIEELENKRKRQIALKKPPRYDKSCLKLSNTQITEKIATKVPFIWRFAIDETQKITIQDLAHGNIEFDMKNFSDFALSREDGSFTFLFANFVDDMLMKITHVIRGEDHLSNTANQAALFLAFNTKLPFFWHLPIICSKDGKKLSKRDFGFSLDDLKQGGFLPEAICNYLALIGNSFQEEVQDLASLAKNYNFSHMRPTGAICYDLEKLTWLNHQWILRLPTSQLLTPIKPFLYAAYPESKTLTDTELETLLNKVKPSLKLISDSVSALRPYFITPTPSKEKIQETIGQNLALVLTQIQELIMHESFDFDAAKKKVQAAGGSVKNLYSTIRYATTEQFEGLGMHELVALLGTTEFKKRIEDFLKQF